MVVVNEVQSWARSQDRSPQGGSSRSAAEKPGGDGLLRLRADVPPEIAAAIDSFERSSFRLTYAIVGFAGAALVFTFLIATCMILVTGR